jgi:hypothetical protein
MFAITLGVHLATAHFKHAENDINPGIYAMVDAPYVGRVTGGVVKNSYGRISWHLSKVWKVGVLDVSAGLATGYTIERVDVLCQPGYRDCYEDRGVTRGRLAPMVSVSYQFNLGDIKPRVSLLPKGVHLSMEF